MCMTQVRLFLEQRNIAMKRFFFFFTQAIFEQCQWMKHSNKEKKSKYDEKNLIRHVSTCFWLKKTLYYICELSNKTEFEFENVFENENLMWNKLTSAFIRFVYQCRGNESLISARVIWFQRFRVLNLHHPSMLVSFQNWYNFGQ